MCVNNLSKVAFNSAAAGIEPRDLPNHCTTEPHSNFNNMH